MKAFVFPGQGAQFVGMGKDLYENSPLAKELFEKANDILGYRITDIMFEGTDEDLRQTKVTQPAVFLHSVITAIAQGEEFCPDMVAGFHSFKDLQFDQYGGDQSPDHITIDQDGDRPYRIIFPDNGFTRQCCNNNNQNSQTPFVMEGGKEPFAEMLIGNGTDHEETEKCRIPGQDRDQFEHGVFV